MRISRALTWIGGLLGSAGVVLILALVLRPNAIPVPIITLPPLDIATPAPSFFGAPLPVPGSLDDAPVEIVLPVMAVDSEVPVESAASSAESVDTPVPPVPQRIVIPSLRVDAPIESVGWHTITIDGQPVGQWDVPAGFAVGWHNTSAPLGAAGNTVLNGHHNTNGEVFGDLIDLDMGAEIMLISGEDQYRYIVAQAIVLQEQWQTPEERLTNARWIQPSIDERLTLVTCWPPESNSHRLIVVAVPAGNN